jgi:hypothetical protein
MARVILFGGGDGGGFIIGPNGIKPIPPWDPEISKGLQAIAGLSQAASHSRHGSLFERTAEQLATELIPNLIEDGGELQGDDSAVLFAGFDGDFTCGSTGQRPVPIPRPRLLKLAGEFA